MTFLPIAERELRIAARLPSTYRNRSLAAGTVMLIAVAILMFGAFARSSSQAGIYMFRMSSFVAMVFCAFEGMRKTADSLSREKRDGTLGLLFLTDLKGYDIVVGKFVGASLSSIYGLLAILPVLALPLPLGGVTLSEYWRMLLALANILFFSLCVGMLVSARCRTEAKSWAGTFFIVLAAMLAPTFVPVGSIAAFSPARSYLVSFATIYPQHQLEYWQSLLITQILSWLMLGIASAKLPFWWQDLPTPRAAEESAAPPRLRRDLERRRSLLEKLLAINPALWLASRQASARIYPWLLMALAAMGGLLCLTTRSPDLYLAAYFLVINLVLKIRIAYQACHCLAEARRNGALEMLLSTPLTVNEIIQGQILGLRRNLLAPVVFLIIAEFLEIFIGLQARSGQHAVDSGTALFTAYFFHFGLDVAAVTWAGMWFGLTSRRESQAVTKTVLWVLLLPYACSLALCWLGAIFFIIVPVFWMVWCSRKLKTEFRNAAVDSYAPKFTGFRSRRSTDSHPMPSAETGRSDNLFASG
jgi:ABC-type transport system involved in multi-copper enzyme maturation permease subunit